MFGPMVNGAMRAAAMDSFGVNASRSNMAQLAQEVANGEGAVLPFSQWWAQAAKCKGVGQWAVKLKALGMPTDETPQVSSFAKIGQKLYARMLQDGSWASSDQQTIVIQ